MFAGVLLSVLSFSAVTYALPANRSTLQKRASCSSDHEYQGMAIDLLYSNEQACVYIHHLANSEDDLIIRRSLETVFDMGDPANKVGIDVAQKMHQIIGHEEIQSERQWLVTKRPKGYYYEETLGYGLYVGPGRNQKDCETYMKAVFRAASYAAATAVARPSRLSLRDVFLHEKFDSDKITDISAKLMSPISPLAQSGPDVHSDYKAIAQQLMIDYPLRYTQIRRDNPHGIVQGICDRKGLGVGLQSFAKNMLGKPKYSAPEKWIGNQ